MTELQREMLLIMLVGIIAIISLYGVLHFANKAICLIKYPEYLNATTVHCYKILTGSGA